MVVRTLSSVGIFVVGLTIGCAVLAAIFIAAIEEGMKAL